LILSKSFVTQKKHQEDEEREQEEIKRSGGTEDDKVTWTGRKIDATGRTTSSTVVGGVGNYLKRGLANGMPKDGGEDDFLGDMEEDIPYEHPKKKSKVGFGSFDNW